MATLGGRTRSAHDGRYRPHSPRSAISRFAVFLIALTALAVASTGPGLGGQSTGQAQGNEPFLTSDSVVVLSDRPVCSLLGDSKTQIGVRAQDFGAFAELNGRTYWAFGDTLLAGGAVLPNMAAWSDDSDASDCVSLIPKQVGGWPAPLLHGVDGEVTVWPVAFAPTASDRVHFFYLSVAQGSSMGWLVAGAGIGSFDTATLAGKRAVQGSLVWKGGQPIPARAFTDGDYVYLVLNVSRAPWTTDTLLARVRKDLVESPASYEYWQPGQPGQWLTGLWDAQAGDWKPALNSLGALWRQPGNLNGADLAYNQYLGKWIAVYTTNYLTSVNIRAAANITGPWTGPETVAVDCKRYHPTQTQGFLCYSGAQHPFYQRDGGRTIYVSYSNHDVHLHEIRLAAPVVQWSNGKGQPVYMPAAAGAAGAQDGLTAGGISFYASDIPVPGFSPIHRWQGAADGEIRYAATGPAGEGYLDLGVAFYAPVTAEAAAAANVPYEPVYRWMRDGVVRYSPMSLASLGYTQEEIAFYGACPDGDSDRLSDCHESFLGTNATNSDTDADGIGDGYEATARGCDPVLANADDQDGVDVPTEMATGTSPCIWDSGAWGCSHAPLRDPGCDVDSDGDHCPDAWELGPDPRTGGQRDPHYFWDVYNPDGRGYIDLFDITAVARRFATTGAATSIDDARTTPPPTGYHASFDRGPLIGPHPWNAGPPDGVIHLREIYQLVRQYGQGCPYSGL